MDVLEWSGSRSGSNGSSMDDVNDPLTVLEAIPVVTDGLDGGWFGKVGTSAMLVLGTFGNVMTITILRRLKTGWSAMKLYLTALALSDTAMLYSGALPMWTRKVLHYDLYACHVLMCKVAIWVMNTSAALSAWLLVALTAQRAASVVWPHRVNLLCTRQKSVVIIVVITVTCCALYSHTLYGYQLVRLPNSTSVRCTFGFAAYQAFWISVWVRVDMFVYSLLPCLFLILGNAVLGWKMAGALKHAREQLSASATDHGKDSRSKKTSSATVTVIMVSTAFVFITLPLMTYNSFFHSYASEDQRSREFHYFLYDFFFVFGMCNFAWNFYLYCLTGTMFRREFTKLLFGCCKDSSSSTLAESAAYVTGDARHAGSGKKKSGSQRPGESTDDF